MNPTILVADRDASMRTLIREILESGGYRIVTASDQDAAAEALAAHNPDVALVAVDLAEEGDKGFALLARRSNPVVPFILMVDASVADPLDAVRQSGAETYLPKPVDRARLLAVARQGVTARRLALRIDEQEDDLARMRTVLRGVVDAVDGAFFILDENGTVVESGGSANVPDRSLGDAGLGRPYPVIFPPEVCELQAGVLAKAHTTGQPARIEEHKGGAVVETVVTPLASNGIPAGFVVVRRDITARRRGEVGPTEDDEQYRSVFDGSNEAIFIVDRESGLIVNANHAAASSLGYESREMRGVPVEQMILRPDKIRIGMQKGLARIAYEYLRRKDGGSVPVEISLSYFSSAGREIVVLYAQDVSRRKIVEEALREGARLYRAVVEDQEELICRYSPEGKLIFVNGAYARFFGEDEDEVVGRDCFTHLGSVDRRQLQEWLDKAGPSEPVLKSEVRQVRADGEMRWIQWTSRAILDERRVVVEVQAVGRDVTERRNAEQALNEATVEKEQYRLNLIATFSSIPDAILTVDSDLVIMASNNAAASLLAFEKGRMRGLKLDEVVAGDTNPCVSVLKQVLKAEKPVRGYEIEMEVPSLGARMVEINCSPLEGQDHNQEGAVLVVRDISRVTDLEKKLQQRHGFRSLVGSSASMQDMYELLEQLSSLESIVLILGESGTGKELVAEALHYGGVRAANPLIKVNCSALSESLLESELFGHVKGAFTGAVRDKVGRIQAAQGGTLFLDEIGDISPLIQLKLLRFLEQKEYERVGDTRTQSADVRIIAATNVDLHNAVRQGAFREDLYYRLNVMPVHVPPLRKRQADIPQLVDHFLVIFSEQFGKAFESVSEEVMDLFMGYRWPGNVRELRHALEHACILSPGKSVTLKHIRKDLVEQAYAQQTYAPPMDQARGGQSSFAVPFQARKPGREDVLAALAECGGNKVRAARQLGIHRATLYRKLKAWGVEG